MLSCGAMRAHIVGAPNPNRPDHGKKGLGAQFLKACRVSARTRDRQVIGIRLWELQKLRQSGGPGVMHRGTDSGLDTLQIETTGRLVITEDDAKQLLYFARDFLLDGLRRFFSWAIRSVGSTGRKRQILRLTSTSSSVRPLNLRYSATSLCAFRTAAGEGRF